MTLGDAVKVAREVAGRETGDIRAALDMVADAAAREDRASHEKKVLTEWDWDTLVAAWRYYEYRSTIASAMFPMCIFGRFFMGKYSEEDCKRIAHQFAYVDHKRKGEEDWNDLPDVDKKPWCVFYAFCKAYCDGFTAVRVKYGGKEEGIKAFWCEATGHWHSADNPRPDIYIADECIIGKSEAAV